MPNYDVRVTGSIPLPVPSALAPAKLNLGLHVLRRRADGYHDLASVFVPLPWHDRLTAEVSDVLTLTCSDARLPVDEGNLVMRAALALQSVTGTPMGATLHLDKHLPYGAGLGSGSSDAAAALRLLADLWQVEVPTETLHTLALELGSDVPFFLDAVPALAEGRGERLTPLMDADGEPYRLPFPVVVAVPPVHVSTAEAYRLVTPRTEGRPDLAALVASNDLDRWQAELLNDFEAPVCAAHPELDAMRLALRDAGAAYVSMSGSGSAFFGVFEEDRHALAAAEALRFEGHRVWHGVLDVS